MAMDGPLDTAGDALTRLAAALVEPLLLLARADSRVYAPFLVSSGLLAAAVWARHLRGRVSLRGFLFSKRVWLHPSSLLDLRFLFARAVARAVLYGPLALSSLGVAWVVSQRLESAFGARLHARPGSAAVVVAFTVTAFVAEDLARYLVHRLAHQVPALWELHKLHHSAEVLTPLTVYRAHPVEGLLMRSGAILAVGLVGGVFHWAFPGQVTGATVLGVDAIGFAWNLLGANLRHSHVWLSYGRRLEHVFISPAQHQIHHSDSPEHHHTNYGSTLAVWDWLGGSLYVTEGRRERLRFGLGAEKNHEDTVASALVAPLAAALRRAIGLRGRGGDRRAPTA